MSYRLKLSVIFAALAMLSFLAGATSSAPVTLADGGPIMTCPPKDKQCWIHNPLPPRSTAVR